MTEMRMKNQKRNCPSCGAPIVSEICTYCGTATGLNTAEADMEHYPVYIHLYPAPVLPSLDYRTLTEQLQYRPVSHQNRRYRNKTTDSLPEAHHNKYMFFSQTSLTSLSKRPSVVFSLYSFVFRFLRIFRNNLNRACYSLPFCFQKSQLV